MGGTLTAQMLPARAGVRGTSRGARAVVLPLLLVIAALALGLALFPTPAAAGVADRIDEVLRSSGFGGSGTGIYVWDLDAALPVYGRNADTMLAPASNLKLVTSAAAVFGWGFEHRFTTGLYAAGEPVDAQGTLFGDLYLVGRGDPSLSTRAYQKDTLEMKTASFETFARQVKRAGIRRIEPDETVEAGRPFHVRWVIDGPLGRHYRTWLAWDVLSATDGAQYAFRERAQDLPWYTSSKEFDGIGSGSHRVRLQAPEPTDRIFFRVAVWFEGEQILFSSPERVIQVLHPL